MFEKDQAVAAFSKLGQLFGHLAQNHPPSASNLLAFYEKFQRASTEAFHYNGWFTPENIRLAFSQWAEALTSENLDNWLAQYPLLPAAEPKKVGIIMAGNLPLVGFHDLLCTVLAGHVVVCKTSRDDNRFYPLIHSFLETEYQELGQRIRFVEKLSAPEAVIATGSNNTARYFEAYFGKYPHIIRKNRNSVAVLSGSETEKELTGLGHDVFDYFGLGCRNVSKLYLPQGYDLDTIFSAWLPFSEVINNKKYGNNYDYNRAVYLLNKVPFLENGFLIARQAPELTTPVSVVNYEFYSDASEVKSQISARANEIQCVVSREPSHIDFGKTQHPNLMDYADGVDVMKFLVQL